MSEEEDRCAITLTPFREMQFAQILYLPCMHRFDREAIFELLKRQLREGEELLCPLCKTPVGVDFLRSVDPHGRLVDRSGMTEDELEAEKDAEWLGSSDEEDEEDDDDSPGSLVDFIVESDEEDSDAEFVPPDEDEEMAD